MRSNSLVTLIGSLSNDDGNGNENVTRKYIFLSFALLRDYFNSLNFYKNGELSRNQIGKSGVQVKKPSCGHVLHKTLNGVIFTLLFCRGRQRNVPKCKTHVESDCFCSLNVLFCGVHRCRRRRRYLSSLINHDANGNENVA